METENAVRKMIERIEADPEGRQRASETGNRRPAAKIDRKRRAYKLDKGGWEIPEHLLPVFEKRKCLTALVSQLQSINAKISRLLEANHPAAAYFDPIAYREAYRKLHSQLQFAIPWAVCRLCGGDGGAGKNCRACKGTGWMNEEVYRGTLKVLKCHKKTGNIRCYKRL